MCTMQELKTWADFVNKCLDSSPGSIDDWWLRLGVRTLFESVLVYQLILAAAIILVGIQLYYIIAIATLGHDEPRHLKFGWIREDGYRSNMAWRLITDYRVLALLVSFVMNLWLIRSFPVYVSPPRLLQDLGVSQSPWQLSPDGVDLVKGYLLMWWLSGMAWCVASLFIVMIVRMDPYDHSSYRIETLSRVMLDSEPTVPLSEVCKNWGSDKRLDTRRKLYRPIYISWDELRWANTRPKGSDSDSWQQYWVKLELWGEGEERYLNFSGTATQEGELTVIKRRTDGNEQSATALLNKRFKIGEAVFTLKKG